MLWCGTSFLLKLVQNIWVTLCFLSKAGCPVDCTLLNKTELLLFCAFLVFLFFPVVLTRCFMVPRQESWSLSLAKEDGKLWFYTSSDQALPTALL